MRKNFLWRDTYIYVGFPGVRTKTSRSYRSAISVATTTRKGPLLNLLQLTRNNDFPIIIKSDWKSDAALLRCSYEIVDAILRRNALSFEFRRQDDHDCDEYISRRLSMTCLDNRFRVDSGWLISGGCYARWLHLYSLRNPLENRWGHSTG